MIFSKLLYWWSHIYTSSLKSLKSKTPLPKSFNNINNQLTTKYAAPLLPINPQNTELIKLIYVKKQRNYLNISSHFPLSKHPNPMAHFLKHRNTRKMFECTLLFLVIGWCCFLCQQGQLFALVDGFEFDENFYSILNI